MCIWKNSALVKNRISDGEGAMVLFLEIFLTAKDEKNKK